MELCGGLDLTTILIGLIVFLVVSYVISQREIPGIPPGPSFLPIIGNILDTRGKYLQKRHRYFYELKEKYGNIYRIYLGSEMVVVLNSFDLISEAFVKQKDVFNDRPTEKMWATKTIIPKEARGLIWENGTNWKNVKRQSLHSLRNLGVGKSLLDQRIQEESAFLVDVLNKSAGNPITMSDLLIKATTNIVMEVVFGERFDYDDSNLIEIVEVFEAAFKGEGFFNPIHFLPSLRFTPLLPIAMSKMLSRHNQLMAFFDKRIKEHEDTLNPEDVRDFIDVCLLQKEDSSKISRANMIRAIQDLFFAGTDTTACTLDWAILYMILYPNIQKRCQQEIDAAVGSNRMVEWPDRTKMPFTEATIIEVQRLGNTVPLTIPHMATEDAHLGGYVIPKGSFVYGNLYAAHLDPKYWKEPFKFKPERFLGEDNKPKKNTSFLPFSMGPRLCPGESLAKMELFVFFTNMLQKFTFSKHGAEVLSTDGTFGISMSPVHYKCQITRRC